MAEITASVATDQIIGDRRYQEDYSAAVEWENGFWLLVLADGMGGEVGGAKASLSAIEGFRDNFVATKEQDANVRLRAALDAANRAIGKIVEQDPRMWGMGTTLVGLTFDNGYVRWISVGDSPLWMYRGGKLRRLNENHSVAGELDAKAARGEITEAEAKASNERHRLLEAVMGQAKIELVDAPEEAMRVLPGDVLLLASDGVETCALAELEEILGGADMDAAQMVDAILRRVEAHNIEYQDNATVMVMIVSGDDEQDEPPTVLPATMRAAGGG